MATSVVFPRAQFFSNNGKPLIGGRIHTYVAGSSTRSPTYRDAAKTQPNTNPILLDGRGEAAIYLSEGVEYKFVLEDAAGALILTQEPVYGAVWPNAAEWPSDTTLSYQYMTEAKAVADATSAAEFYDTYAQALLSAAGARRLVEVARDETRAGSRTRYWAQAGALNFSANLDQVRLDLATDAGSAMTGHVAVGAGATPISAQEKMRQSVALEDYGGIGNGLADESAALAKAQAALPNGGVIRGLNGKQYYFPNGFTLNRGISFPGAWVPREDVALHTPYKNSSCILLGSGSTITVGNGAELRNWLIWRADLVAATSANDAAAKVASFTGTAVEAQGADASVHHNTIIGFEWGLRSVGCERPQFFKNQFDCTNYVNVSQCYDIGFVVANHGWPFFTVHRPWTTDALLRRNGVGYKIDDVADFIYAQDNFAYGQSTSYYFSDIAAGTVSGNKADNAFSVSQGCIGIETRGNMNNVVLDNNHVDSHDVNYRFAHTAGAVIGGSNTSGQSHGPAFQCGPSSAGALGRVSAAGSCNYVIDFLPGIKKWHIGCVLANTVSASGVAYSLAEVDRAKIQIGFTTVLEGGVVDNIGYGSSNIPAIRVSHDSDSGLFENRVDGTIGVVVNGLPACIFQPTAGAVNFPIIKHGSAGQSVRIGAEGEDNVTISIMPKGAGYVQLGATYVADAVPHTGYVTMYDASGQPRRFLVG